jgi:hypothetical protein
MKALSVRAPWAQLIASGKKTLEIRSKPIRYRGDLLICESRGGGAVAVVEVVGCHMFAEADDEASGGVWSNCPNAREYRWAWELRLLRRVTSPLIKGSLGFFDVDFDAADVRAAGP